MLSKVFPEYSSGFKAITNGIYLERWMNPELYKLYIDDKLNQEKLYDIRVEARSKLEELLSKYKENIEIGDKTVVLWTHRLARYKRPYFIARFIEEHPDIDAVFTLGGKHHLRDNDGLNYARWFRKLHLRLKNVVYIHDCSVENAQVLF